MKNKNLKGLFNKNLIGRRNPIQKVFRSPMKMLYSILLAEIAKKYNRTYSLKASIFSGDKINVIFPNDDALGIFRCGFIEEGLTSIVLKYLKPGDTFLDLGAHIGYYTLLASTIVEDNGAVHSFEPTPSTFFILQLNCNDRSNIFLNNCAVFSEETFLTFNDYGIKNSERNSFVTGRFVDKKVLKNLTPKKIKVPSISIDKYVWQKKLIPDFIKIDVESAEYEVLKGMSQTIKNFKPIITIEVGDMEIETIVQSRTCVEYLIERGYRAYEYKEGRIIKHELKERYSYDNLLFLPKSIHS